MYIRLAKPQSYMFDDHEYIAHVFYEALLVGAVFPEYDPLGYFLFLA